MAAPTRKHRSRRRVAAFNFLSNISLDGSHTDTQYAIFNRKGLFESNDKPSLPTRSNTEPDNLKKSVADDQVHDVENRPPETTLTTITNGQRHVEKTAQSSTSGTAPPPETNHSTADIFEQNADKTETTGPSKRYRASSYSGERPATTKRRLFHTLSISEDCSPPSGRQSHGHIDVLNDIPSMSSVLSTGTRCRHRSTSSSTSSLGSSSGAKPKKEVRFFKPGGRHKPIRKERVVLLSSRKAPFVIYSSIPYSKHSSTRSQNENPKEQQIAVRKISYTKNDLVDKVMMRTSGTHLQTAVSTSNEGLLHLGLLAVEKVEDGQDISYSEFLVPSKTRVRKVVSTDVTLNPISESTQSSPGILAPPSAPLLVARSLSHDPSVVREGSIRRHSPHHIPHVAYDRDQEVSITDHAYDPNELDDPELRSGKHRTLMTFPSYMISVIDYAKPSQLKRELNEKFKEKFPHIQLSLSKLRSLKRDLRKIANLKCSIDLWTVAQSYVYFEKIILKGLINKPNRRLCAGACLLLSSKLNDVKGTELSKLIEEIVDTFKLHQRDLLAFEFAVLVALEFSLHIQDLEIYPHYQRLMYTS